MRAFLACLLLAAGSAHGQGEIILDNGGPGFSVTGSWATSTSVSGFFGPNYQSHEANGAPPSAIVVDNGGPGFSVTGTWPVSTAVSGHSGPNYQVHAANGEPPSAILADNASGVSTGTWPASTSVSGYVGTNYQVHPAGTGTSVFTWTLNVPSAATYQVYARWTQHPNRATNAKYTVNHASGAQVVTVNMEQGGGSWNLLGSFAFNAGAATVSLSDDANDYVIADAVMLVPAGAAPNTATWTLAVPTSGSYQVYARWTQHPNRATDAKYTVTHASGSTQVTVNQEAGGGNWSVLGTFDFNAGDATVSLTDQANGYVIADAVMLVPPGAGANTATWTPNVAQAGTYEVYARWTQHTNRASNATYTVTHASGSSAIAVNQQQSGGAWNLLGVFSLTPGSTHKVSLNDQANGFVIADAIRIVPIAVQTEPKLYFIHVDHLNTPRVIYNANQQLRWKWEQQEPFGVTVPDENPSSLGVLEYPGRFSGQYFDKETNLTYNYRRNYDPATGRFAEVDPLGLGGGVNGYSYVDSDPLGFVDPLGTQRYQAVVPQAPTNPIANAYGTYLVNQIQRINPVFQYQVVNTPGQIGYNQQSVQYLNGVLQQLRAGAAGVNCTYYTYYSPANPGPLPLKVANTFRSGTYYAGNLTQPQTMYRVIGPNGNPTGSFWSAMPPAGPTSSMLNYSLLPQWGNNATTTVTATVPAGTTVYFGVAAPQGGLQGGAQQIYIPTVNSSWIGP